MRFPELELVDSTEFSVINERLTPSPIDHLWLKVEEVEIRRVDLQLLDG
jgi:hypothetical protein